MPRLITRDEALEQMRAERDTERGPACLMCAVHAGFAGRVYPVFEDDEFLVFLPRFVRRWGHVVVSIKPHVTRYADVPWPLWMRANHLAWRAGRMVERVQDPKRVYITSSGSSAGELTQTSSHIHIHVIPLYDTEDRPADVFSWQAGVLTGEHDEWVAQQALYVPAWERLAEEHPTPRER